MVMLLAAALKVLLCDFCVDQVDAEEEYEVEKTAAEVEAESIAQEGGVESWEDIDIDDEVRCDMN